MRFWTTEGSCNDFFNRLVSLGGLMLHPRMKPTKR
jgi:hypothetical protein